MPNYFSKKAKYSFVLIWIIFYFFIIVNSISAIGNYEIKSLRVFQANNQTSFPISISGSKITIEFDLECTDLPNWEIFFVFCDKNWEPYENGLLRDDIYNTEKNLWFENIPFKSDKANYHYVNSFPNENVKFPFSGKWRYFIQDAYNSDLIFGEGKFYVVNESIIYLKTNITNQIIQGMDIVPAVFGQVWNLQISVIVPDSLFVDKVNFIEMIENKKIEDPIIILKTYDNEFIYYEVDSYNSLSFFAKNIKPGSAYRQVNLMDKSKYQYPKTFAHFEGVEVSNKFNPSKSDLFGGSKIMDYKSLYSEYLDVQFQLRTPDKYYKNIFIVGSFTNWEIYPEYKLNEKDGIFSANVELKRGIYDYQYVVADIDGNYLSNINWIELEGNSWLTNREFYIFLFYNTDELGGYDKIIAYKKIWSRN